MEIKENLRYTKDHIWVIKEGDHVRLGLTGYLQKDIGDVLLVELPKTGRVLKRGENFGLIETSKAVVDLKSPVSGKIIEVNGRLEEDPDALKDSPYGDGWLIVLQPAPDETLDHLLTPAEYKELLKGKV